MNDGTRLNRIVEEMYLLMSAVWSTGWSDTFQNCEAFVSKNIGSSVLIYSVDILPFAIHSLNMLFLDWNRNIFT